MKSMIRLTQFNPAAGSPDAVYVDPDDISSIHVDRSTPNPSTLITLKNGTYQRVTETGEEVMQLIDQAGVK